MNVTEAQDIMNTRDVVTVLQPHLLDCLARNILSNLENKLAASQDVENSESIKVNTNDGNPTPEESGEIAGHLSRKRRRVKFDDGIEERWDGAFDNDTITSKRARNNGQLVQKSQKEDQRNGLVARGRRTIKTKEYSSYEELMRDVHLLSQHIKAGSERETMLLLDAIVI
jgi:hypothetical protein